MKKKKIIFTVSNDLTYDQRMIRICTSLSNNYEVLLVGRKKRDSIPIITRCFHQKRLYCFFQKGKFFYLEYNIRLLWFLMFVKTDAICAIDLDTLLPSFLVTKLRSKICIFDSHEYFTEVPEVVNRALTKSVWEGIASLCIPRIKHCYTVCESLAEIFEAKYKRHFEVIRNVPFLQKKINRRHRHATKVLLYQGVLNEGRGLAELIEAVKPIENVVLWLAGEGDLSKQLRSMVGEAYQEKIKFLGYLSPEKLKAVTLEADIGFNLLENKGKSYYYSLANKFFDYIQTEIPSVNMNFPEYKKINDKYRLAILIDDLQISSIAKAIRTLCTDDATYELLRQNCQKAKSVFCWENEEEKLLAIYTGVFC